MDRAPFPRPHVGSPLYEMPTMCFDVRRTRQVHSFPTRSAEGPGRKAPGSRTVHSGLSRIWPVRPRVRRAMVCTCIGTCMIIKGVCMGDLQQAVHHTILVVDVEGYGDLRKTTPHRVSVRDGLYLALQRAFDDAGLPWPECRRESTGDGVFVLAPAQLPKGPFVEFLPSALAEALRRHNETHRPE